jgi:hypothetical protein
MPISFGTAFGLHWQLEGLWSGVALALGLWVQGICDFEDKLTFLTGLLQQKDGSSIVQTGTKLLRMPRIGIMRGERGVYWCFDVYMGWYRHVGFLIHTLDLEYWFIGGYSCSNILSNYIVYCMPSGKCEASEASPLGTDRIDRLYRYVQGLRGHYGSINKKDAKIDDYEFVISATCALWSAFASMSESGILWGRYDDY